MILAFVAFLNLISYIMMEVESALGMTSLLYIVDTERMLSRMDSIKRLGPPNSGLACAS